jgi:predicted O-methyltransferase YrrM
MTTHEVLARLATDRPKFHYVTAENSLGHAAKGIDLPEGPIDISVSPGVLTWIAGHVKTGSVTAETGSGYTTVVLASLARRHHCFTHDPDERDRILAYLPTVGIDPDRVTFHIGSTDQTLPVFRLDTPLDFAYLDGCHGYPFPALDWHYLDKHLRVGGVVGMDNVELRPVREHCHFLEENGSYRRVGFVYESYFAHFYEKQADEGREWSEQAYSRSKKDPCDWRLKTRIKRRLSRAVRPWLY